eukprot:8956675-Pyramimonas_sp.AAC.1
MQPALVAAAPAAAGGAEAPMALDASSIKFDIPLDLKAFAFSELFNPGCFSELSGAFGLQPGIIADLHITDEDGESYDLREHRYQRRYMQTLEDQDPYFLLATARCSRSKGSLARASTKIQRREPGWRRKGWKCYISRWMPV